MPRIKKILAPTDFSDVSKLGVRYALEMARDASAEVVVYHAIEVGGEWKDNPPKVAAYHDMLEERRRLLGKFVADNFADCIDLVEVRYAVEFGTPHKNIVEKAADEAVDMIVMSTHGRTGVNHFILGSIAEKVVARAPCPVLIVPRARAQWDDGQSRLIRGKPGHLEFFNRRRDDDRRGNTPLRPSRHHLPYCPASRV